MSKGTTNRVIRIDDASWAKFELYVEHRNDHSPEEPWTISDFIRVACQEKMKKMDRSRGRALDDGDEMMDVNAPPPELCQGDFFTSPIEDTGAIA